MVFHGEAITETEKETAAYTNRSIMSKVVHASAGGLFLHSAWAYALWKT